MATPGQPALYKTEYCELAHNYLRFEKALLPVTVIFDPCNGTQKFALLRAEPTGRGRSGKNMRHAGE
jgi:hypothetical protein